MLKTVKLGEIVTIIGGGTPSKKQPSYWDNGTIKWATVGDMNVEIINKTQLCITEKGLKESSSNIISNEAIVIATRVGLGKVCYLESATAINQDLKGLLPNIKKTNKNYLFYFLKSISDYIIENGTGATVKGVKLDFIKNIDIPLPPLSEQQRIVSKLDLLFLKIDKSIALHVKNMAEADAFMGSVLNDVFGELEEKYNKDYLSNFCTITSSKRVYKNDYVEDGVLFYRIKDIVLKCKGLELKDAQFISEDAFNTFDEKFGSPQSGDILITAVGATLGYVYLVTDNDGQFYFKDGNILWLKNINKDLDREYIVHSFNSPLFQQYIEEISKGAAQPAITIVKLKELKIPIPPLQIQQKTVTYLDEISKKIENIKQVQKEKMASLKALKASILDQAFRGEL